MVSDSIHPLELHNESSGRIQISPSSKAQGPATWAKGGFRLAVQGLWHAYEQYKAGPIQGIRAVCCNDSIWMNFDLEFQPHSYSRGEAEWYCPCSSLHTTMGTVLV